MEKRKKIGIDARLYGPIGKGLGRYTQELVDNITNLDKKNEYVIFLRKENYHKFKPRSKRIKKVLADVRWYTIKEQIIMPYLIHKEKIDLMHFLHFNIAIFCPVKFITTIHDLILINHPTPRASKLSPLLYKIKNLAYKITIKRAIKKSEKIITVSNFTKKDILKNFKTKEEEIVVTYEGVTKLEDKKNENNKEFKNKNITEPFLLYVGNAYPHKNLNFLIKSFPEIKKINKNLKLVLVGKEDYFYKRLKRMVRKEKWLEKEKNKIIFSGYVPDNELHELYKKASAYVFPSLYEGFGLPPLEAMNRGCPVLSSEKSCLPEILGEAALYFNPKNKKDFLKKVNIIMKNTKKREELIKKGKEQTKKYDWIKCAKKTLKVYQNILKK
jgi:glycosyltransferase involved in cell wall biosynthesis